MLSEAWEARWPVCPEINQEIGTTRPRASFLRNKFGKLGSIDHNVELNIPHFAAEVSLRG
jgi:hypothetical protein